MPVFNNIMSGASAQGGGDLGDTINQSLRFNGSNTFLSRAITADSAGTTSTFSFWIKFAREKDDITDTVWSYGGSSYFQYPLTKVLRAYGGGAADSDWTSKARDYNAWYHIVMHGNGNVDTTNNRMWVNGREISTEFNTRDFPGLTRGSTFRIGDNTNGDQHFSGYLADFICVAGSAVTPLDNFGKFNDDNIWVPVNYTGSFGAKGFRLKFDPNGVAGQTGDGAGIGADHSGNNNHFTPSGFTTTAISASNFDNDVNYEDTPTNNFATFTPLVKHKGQGLYFDGNLGFSGHSNGTWSTTTSSQRVDTGKWYFEVQDNENEIVVGVVDEGWNSFYTWQGLGKYPGSATTSLALGYKTNNGQKWENGSATNYGPSGAAGSVYGVAWDADTGTIWVHKDGTWANSATQAEVEAGTTTNAMFTGKTTGKKWRFAVSHAMTGDSDRAKINFGQRDFVHTVPSGYKTLCTANQPEPSIKDGRNHFAAVEYNGGSGTVAETGLLFKPDLIWYKSKSHATEHAMFDSVRGAAAGHLDASNNSAQSTSNAALTSFDSNGFTVSAPTGGEWNNGGGRTYMAWCWKAGGTPSVTYTVKVVSDSGNKYRFNDFAASAVTLDLEEGGTYVFDQSDASNSGHPLRFSTTSDGTHGSGTEFTTGVTTTGTPGSAGAKTTIVVGSGTATLHYYCSAHSGMGGQANTNATRGSSNFAGTAQSKVTANTDAGFSIVKWTPDGNTRTVGHGLTAAPEMIMVKGLDGSSWWVYHKSPGHEKYQSLSADFAAADSDGPWADTAPTASVFSVGAAAGNADRGANGAVAYCWHSVKGYSQIGEYRGTGGNTNAFVETGFKPAFVLIKCHSNDANWGIYDNARSPSNPCDDVIRPNLANANDQPSGHAIDFVANGFSVRGLNLNVGESYWYSYMAFAEHPFGGSTKVPPATAR